MAIAPREIAACTPIDHQTAPLLDAVRAYHAQHTLSFTVPGHKCGRGLAPETAAALGREGFVNDIPLAGGADDLHLTRGVLEQAQVLAADAFGATRSFFLVGGSSLTNQILLQAVVAPGEEIIVARNAHKSVLAGLVLSGARPVYVHPHHDATLDVAHGVTPADLATTLAAHPQARAVVLVSPTYFGVAADLPALSAVCRQADVPLVVDEAWGAHFSFHPALPLAAMAAGADASIDSLHKVLTAFSQASLLNLQGTRLDPVGVAGWVNLLQTTSPSALILASMDACRRQMVLHGAALCEQALALAAGARAAINRMPGLHALGYEVVGRPGAAAFDGTKVVVDVSGVGLSGYEADTWLRTQRQIAVELSDHRRILALLTVGDDADTVGRLLDGLAALAAEAPGRGAAPRSVTCDPAALTTTTVLTPREAAFATTRSIPLDQASGEVSAELLTPYPPGIPVLAPGECITPAIVAYLQEGQRAGMYVCGASDPSLTTVRVVERT